MAKKIQLSIPKPCHEDWDAMTPVEQGKFCGSCQKQVVDFSTMNDRQVAEFFKKPSTGSVCGRFMTDQLDRSIEIPKKRIPWFKYFFQFALPAFLVSIKATSAKAQGQIRVKTTNTDTTKKPPVLRPKMGLVAPTICVKPTKGKVIMGDIAPEIVTKLNGTIQLKVVDEKGEPIPYASIITGVIGKGGAADKNGSFILDKGMLDMNGEIFVSSAGYERKEVMVKTFSNLTGTFTVVLQEKGWLPEIVVSSYGKTVVGKLVMGYTTKIKGDTVKVIKQVDKKDTTVKNIEDQAKFIVYPNPVTAGASIHLNCQNFTEGYYHFQILDIAGQLISQSEIWIDKETSLFDMPVPASASAGTYLITLISRATGKKYTEKILIQR